MSDDAKEHKAPRVKPQAGATRCPFCHDECAPEVDVVVCRACLSRHHAACWGEGNACASCGAAEFLSAPPADAARVGEAAEPTWLGMRRSDVGLWFLLMATSGLVLGMVQGVAAFRQFFAETGVQLPVLTELALLPAEHPTLVTLALLAWVATAAMARTHRRAFVSVVLAGVLVAVPVLVVALFLPLIVLIEKL